MICAACFPSNNSCNGNAGILARVAVVFGTRSALRFGKSLMPIVMFFVRRILTGIAARAFTNLLVKRFNVSPGAANLIFVVLAELLARGTEKPTASAPGRGFGFGGRKGAR